MRIKELKLQNFKGIDSFDVQFNGHQTSIWGANETGKTTLFDAFCFLLFGKDSLNSANFDIKRLDEKGEPVHGLEHCVEATLNLGDRELTLKKVFSEKWTKRRGSAEKEFTGHAVDHFIDGVPSKEKEFKTAVSSICDENLFRLLTNPRYFNEVLHWQDRRKTLLQVCGDISDEDVIESDISVSGLPKILGKHSLEDYRKIIKSRLPEINRELEKIPVRIDEVKVGATKDLRSVLTVKSVLAGARERRKEQSALISQIENGGEVASINKQLLDLDAKVITIQNRVADKRRRAQQDHDKKRQVLVQAHNKAQAAYDELERHGRNTLAEQKGLQEQIKTIEETIESLRKQWYEADDESFVYESGASICPTCGQALPEEKIAQAIKDAQESWNLSKAKMLSDISAAGKRAKDDLDKKHGMLELAARRLALIEGDLINARLAAEHAMEEIRKHDDIGPDKIPDEPVADIQKEREALLEKLKAVKEGSAGSAAEVTEKIKAIDAEIEGLQKELLQIENAEKSGARIEELKKQERALAAEYEKLEKELYLTEQFIRTKVTLLETKINAKFTLARFKLFAVQINGGLEEVCVTTYKGVPYPSMNNAARIQVGIDICETLSDHWKTRLPIWIDNSESISEIPDTQAQQIRLIVSPEDKTLRIGE